MSDMETTQNPPNAIKANQINLKKMPIIFVVFVNTTYKGNWALSTFPNKRLPNRRENDTNDTENVSSTVAQI